MPAPMYSPPQDSFFTKLDSRALAIALLLTLWHRLRCFGCHQPQTPCCRQPWTRNLAAYHSLASSSLYLVPAVIYKRCYKSSISLTIRACKLICLPGITLKKDQETWLPACDFAWFWGVCYSARPCHLGRSFVAWHLYRELTFEVFGRDGYFVGTQSSTLGAWRIVLSRFSILSRDQGLLCKKPEDDICNWARKTWSRC